MEPKDRIIVAMDMRERGAFLLHSTYLWPHVGAFSVGPRTYLEYGIRALRDKDMRSEIMLDLNFHAIRPVMADAAAAMDGLGIKYFTIHASSGPKIIEAAVQHRGRANVIGTTVLTTHDDADCRAIYGDGVRAKTCQFARWLIASGAQGIICSAHEVPIIRQEVDLDRKLLVIAAGIRPEGYPDSGGHAHPMTPTQAIRAGADILLIGRPIYDHATGVQSVKAANRIADEIVAAL